jgi:hypothetical protein
MATVSTRFYEFDQNNSGGSFVFDDSRGLGPGVWIEALDSDHANTRAESIGIYFDGVLSGQDCGCCGDRWDPAHGGGIEEPMIDGPYTFMWTDTVYVHRIDGTVERVKKPDA